MISVHCTHIRHSFRKFPLLSDIPSDHRKRTSLSRALSRQKILCHLGKTEPHHRYRYRVLPVPLTRKQPLANKVGRSNGMRARRRNVHIRNRELHHSVNSCFLAKRDANAGNFLVQLPETEEERFSLDRGEGMDRHNLTIVLNQVNIHFNIFLLILSNSQ